MGEDTLIAAKNGGERPPFMVPREVRHEAGHAESKASNQAMRLVLRGTFIDIDEEEGDAVSPRALSDPGSEVSSGYSSHFVKERQYIAALSQHVSKTMSSKKSRLSMGSARSESSEDGTGRPRWEDHGTTTQYESSEEASVSRGRPCADFSPTLRTWPAGGAPKSQVLRSFFKEVDKKEAPLVQQRWSEEGPHSSGWSDVSVPRMKTIGLTQNLARKNMSPEELRNLVRKKTVEINDVLKYQHLSTALTSINEIPDQVGEVFHQSATNLLGEVQGEVSVACELFQHCADEQRSTAAEQAAQSITMIPDMIMASFENSFAKAMSTVRIHVDDVIQGLEGSEMAQEQVVKQMWAIPEEVRQITREAVKEAAQESREKVVEQLDCVLQSLPEDSMPDALWAAKRQIVATVSKKLPHTLRAATQAAENNVCQAVKVVQDCTWRGDVTGVVANRVVAETLLRAKVGPSLQKSAAETPGLETLRVCNPGSVGHPELCSRACLYFSLGKCLNGMSCSFCHLPHSKRAAKLDKRHREMLRVMDFPERFRILHPIIQSKLDNVEVVPEFTLLYNTLVTSTSQPNHKEAQPTDRKRTKEIRTLQIAAKYMSIRSLIALLHHAPMAEDSVEHSAIESMLLKIKPDSIIRHYENRPQSRRRSSASDGSNCSRTSSQGSEVQKTD